MISEASLLRTKRPGLGEQRQAARFLLLELTNLFPSLVAGVGRAPPTCQHHGARVAKQHVPGPGWLAADLPQASALGVAAPDSGAAWERGDPQSMNDQRLPSRLFIFLTRRFGMSIGAKLVLMSLVLAPKYSTTKLKETGLGESQPAAFH